MLLENLPLVIVIAFGAITAIELLYYYAVFARFSFYRKKKSIALQQLPVSIIVIVKDSANALVKSLPRLLNQQYQQFEVVIVNDNSEDETEQLVMDYKNQYDNLKFVNLNSAVTTIRGKKFALSIGIRCASYEHLLFTTPDCCPASTHWLEKMSQHFVNQTKIVLGYSTYERKNSPYNRLLHFDNLFNALQYFSYSMINATYRGDTKNMAYTKSLFNAQRGFASHNHIRYGEEDIFISRAATKNNCAIEFSPESFTILQHRPQAKYWRDHKEGLYYTRQFYSFKKRFLLNNYGFVNLLFYAALVASVLLTLHNILYLSITLGIIFVRLLSQYLVFGFAAGKLHEKQVIPLLLIYDLLFAILNPLYYLAAKIHHHRFL